MQIESAPADTAPRDLTARYAAVRSFTLHLCAPLSIEDYVIQSMTDVSPTKWHLAHTTWFFEQFALKPHLPRYREFDPNFAFLFNSYYVQAGERHCRARRGVLSRPTVEDVYRYRAHVDRAMGDLLGSITDETGPVLQPLVELGLNHEQQHQELLLTDVKHVLSQHPLDPGVYRADDRGAAADPGPLSWTEVEAGTHWIGYGGDGFHFDNEGPRHRVFLEAYALADRLVTNGDYLAFMEDGGYERTPLWLSEGWAAREADSWEAPLYWQKRDGQWMHFTLSGMRPVDPHEPLTHLSFFEADAFARWAGARLPSEFEWEAAAGAAKDGSFVEAERYHPAPAAPGSGLRQLAGEVWQWTLSSYAPYPGYEPAPGAIGEYNGKFMVNQYVLRGASCATSRTHSRPTYRNFWHTSARWQFNGLRLARSL